MDTEITLGNVVYTFDSDSSSYYVRGLSNTLYSGPILIETGLGGYSVSKIVSDAFANSSVTKVIIKSAYSENQSFEIESGAFYTCNLLSSVIFLSSSVKNWANINIYENAFCQDENLKEFIVPTCENLYLFAQAFRWCRNLSAFDFSPVKQAITIADKAFGESGLTTVDLPQSVGAIGYGVFSGCTNLITAKISTEAIDTSDNIFEGCSNLADVIFDTSNDVIIPSAAFARCSSLEKLWLPAETESIQDCAIPTTVKELYIPTTSVPSAGWPFYGSTSSYSNMQIFIRNDLQNNFHNTGWVKEAEAAGAQLRAGDSRFWIKALSDQMKKYTDKKAKCNSNITIREITLTHWCLDEGIYNLNIDLEEGVVYKISATDTLRNDDTQVPQNIMIYSKNILGILNPSIQSPFNKCYGIEANPEKRFILLNGGNLKGGDICFTINNGVINFFDTRNVYCNPDYAGTYRATINVQSSGGIYYDWEKEQ